MLKSFVLVFLVLTAWLFACSSTQTKNNPAKSCHCLLDQLKTDTLLISYQSTGCFHGFTETIRVFKTNHDYSALIKTGGPYYNHIQETKQVKLTAAGLMQYKKFEAWMKESHGTDAICTTQDHYLLVVGTDSINVHDMGCEYDGKAYYAFRNAVFGESPK